MRIWPSLVITFTTPRADDPAADDVRDLAVAELDGLDVAAVLESSDLEWQVCFRDATSREEAVARLLQPSWASGFTVARVDVPDEDWARRNQAALGAIHVGRVTITPPWDAAATSPAADVITIVIEPAMGFGSGHHATTRLCLAALQQLDLRGLTVLDIGTGSGVLALAASRLGAAEVVAVDVDPDALDNARENARHNDEPPAIRFIEADFRHERLGPADVVVANLTGGMLTASVPKVVATCRPGGSLVLSGITAEEAETVRAAYATSLTEVARSTEDGWCAFVFDRKSLPE